MHKWPLPGPPSYCGLEPPLVKSESDLRGKEKLLESAAGVALSSDLIQVSVRAMRFSLE